LIENPKLFHNNLPIRATKTGGFFYGSETEQLFKIVRCLTPAQLIRLSLEL